MAWIQTNDKLPEIGKVVKCKMQHFHTKSIQEHLLIRVIEDDYDWRTADDNSEISHDWNVISWDNRN